jgi:tetratricopeptide (TPR) repeat protein
MIAKDSTSSEAKFAMQELGKLKFRLKDFPGTVTAMQRRIALDPNSDEAYYYMGLSYKEMKQMPEAVEALRQSVSLAPGKADRHFWLGIVLSSMPDSSDVSAAFLMSSTEIDSTGKNAAIAFQQLGYRSLLAKEWGKATQLLERAVALNDKDVSTLVWLAQGYQNAGNKTKAIETYRRVLQLDPGNADAKKGIQSLSN